MLLTKSPSTHITQTNNIIRTVRRTLILIHNIIIMKIKVIFILLYSQKNKIKYFKIYIL